MTTQYYADPTLGSSGNDGRSRTTPKATISQCLALAQAGDSYRVNTKPGEVYVEQVTIPFDGNSLADPVVIAADYGWATGALPKIAPTAASQRGVLGNGKNNVKLIQLDITNGGIPSTANGGTTPCVYLNSCSGWRIVACEVHDCFIGASLESCIYGDGTGSDNRVFQCNVHHSTDDLVSGHGVQTNWEVAFNYLHDAGNGDYSGGPPGDGVTTHDQCGGWLVHENLIRRCTKGGMSMANDSGSASKSYAWRNIVLDCARYGIAQINTGYLVAWSNIIFLPDALAAMGGGGTGSFGCGPVAGGSMEAYLNTIINVSSGANAYSLGSNSATVAVTTFWRAYGNTSYCIGNNCRHHGIGAMTGGTNPWNFAMGQNIYWPNDGSRFRYNNGSSFAVAFAAWSAAISSDSTSQVGDPLFKKTPTAPGVYPGNETGLLSNDVRLQAASPGRALFDPSTVVTALLNSLDYFGRDRTRGISAAANRDAGAAQYDTITKAVFMADEED